MKLFLLSVAFFLGNLPLIYIRRNYITEDEIYGMFLGNYVYFTHYFLLISLLLLIINRFIKISASTRNWITVAFLVFVGVVGYINYRHSDIVHTEITLNKRADRESLRIAFVSDLHLTSTSNKSLFVDMVDKINSEKPDIVVFGGDIFQDSYTSLEDGYDEVFAKLQAKYGVYAILGNHEYYGGNVDENIAYIEKLGMKILRDDVLNIDGVNLIGRDDIGNRFAVTNRAALDELYNKYKINPDAPVIVFDHNPNSIPESVNSKADIQLSGHTHAGQFFPYNLLLRNMYPIVVGYEVIDGLHAIVSAGVGVGSWKIIGPWEMPYRFGTDSEINIIDVSFTGLSQSHK